MRKKGAKWSFVWLVFGHLHETLKVLLDIHSLVVPLRNTATDTISFLHRIDVL